jgi:predicted DsbA family dithiol-disulfide isomerase
MSIAKEVGMDNEDEVRKALSSSGELAAETAQEIRAAMSNGVSGVPHFLFNDTKALSGVRIRSVLRAF